jgi:Na+-transporting methylmalonyl-CoA/oxaloacetate decarboxylase gamma subunit
LHLDTVLQGLYIALVGISLVFLALGLIVAAMELMGRYLGPRPVSAEGARPPEPGDDDRARVAAMAAAIILAEQRHRRQPGTAWASASRASAPSPWQASHRSQTLAHRPDVSSEGPRRGETRR